MSEINSLRHLARKLHVASAQIRLAFNSQKQQSMKSVFKGTSWRKNTSQTRSGQGGNMGYKNLGGGMSQMSKGIRYQGGIILY